ncbi:hypothetical protein [Pseudomonas aeruginosa]
MRLESNRDWHRIIGDHALECVFLDSETVVVPATKEQRDIAVSDWNTRAVPADWWFRGSCWSESGLNSIFERSSIKHTRQRLSR